MASSVPAGQGLCSAARSPSGGCVRQDDAAFDLHGRAVLPAAQATLAASGEVQLLLFGRGLTGEGTWIKERILDAAGRPMEEGELQFQTVAVRPFEIRRP
jgi:hypothetical protein